MKRSPWFWFWSAIWAAFMISWLAFFMIHGVGQ